MFRNVYLLKSCIPASWDLCFRFFCRKKLASLQVEILLSDFSFQNLHPCKLRFCFLIFSLEKKLASPQVEILLSDFFFSKLASLQVEILLSDFFSWKNLHPCKLRFCFQIFSLDKNLHPCKLKFMFRNVYLLKSCIPASWDLCFRFFCRKKLASLQVEILLSDFFFSKLASLQVEILLSDFFSWEKTCIPASWDFAFRFFLFKTCIPASWDLCFRSFCRHNNQAETISCHRRRSQSCRTLWQTTKDQGYKLPFRVLTGFPPVLQRFSRIISLKNATNVNLAALNKMTRLCAIPQ